MNRKTDNQPPVEPDGIEPVIQADAAVQAVAPDNVVASVDLNALAKAHEALEQQMKFWAVSVEDTNRSWKQFGEQVAVASGELVRVRAAETRLRDVEQELKRYTVMHSEASERADTLDAQLAEARAREAAANDRAAKFEEICEQIKERALDIHNALQTTRANEQKLQNEQTAIRSELVELRRTAQEEAASRVTAEERIRKLQATLAELGSVEAEARDRAAKLTEENNALALQLPQLVAEAGSWQKQFSASERENARMQAERRLSAERIGELEGEIQTLRSDLASLVTGQAPRPKETHITPAPAVPVQDEIDDLDLVSSLDRAFGRGETVEEVPADDKKH